jgi:hypothetical protein
LGNIFSHATALRVHAGLPDSCPIVVLADNATSHRCDTMVRPPAGVSPPAK